MIHNTIAFGVRLNFWESIGIFLLGAGVIIGAIIGIMTLILFIRASRRGKITKKRHYLVFGILAVLFLVGPMSWNKYYDYRYKKDTIAAEKYEQSILDSLTFHPLKPTILPELLQDAKQTVSIIDKNNSVLSPNGDIALEFSFEKRKKPDDMFNVIANVDLYEVYKPAKQLADNTCPEDHRKLYTDYNKEKLVCKVIGFTTAGQQIVLADDQRYEFRRQLDYYVDIGDTRAIVSYAYYTDSTKVDGRLFTDQDALILIRGLQPVNSSDITLSKL